MQAWGRAQSRAGASAPPTQAVAGRAPPRSKQQQHVRRRQPALRAVDSSAADAVGQQQPQQLLTPQNGASNGNGVYLQQQGAPAGAAAAAAVAAAAAGQQLSGVSASVEEQGLDGIQMQDQRDAAGLYVRVRGMVKHFNTAKGVFRAVDGADVDIPPSSICALLGPSGSGKTTLLRLVAGLEAPTGGRIFFDDVDATDLAVQDRQVGMVFQSYALFNHMTVADNIKFGLQVRKLAVDHDKRVADLLELVQLSGLGDRFPRQLSGGQRQRVALARALASNPRLLLLDEPFGALDAVVRKQLRAGLKEIVRSVGVTTIIVTHDQEEAFDLADKVVIFNRGLIEQAGSPADIIRAPATPFVMGFVGETNSVPASCLLVRRSGFAPGPKARVLFRPSDMQLWAEMGDGGAPGAAPRVPATVVEAASLGWISRFLLRFDDDVEVEYSAPRLGAGAVDASLPLDVGNRIYISVRPGAMMAYDEAELGSAPLV